VQPLNFSEDTPLFRLEQIKAAVQKTGFRTQESYKSMNNWDTKQPNGQGDTPQNFHWTIAKKIN
jgi:hypothetical protein